MTTSRGYLTPGIDPQTSAYFSIDDSNRSDVITALQEAHQKAIAIEQHLDATVYANSDWSGASTSSRGRLCIAIDAVQLGAKSIEPFFHHGVRINGRYISAVNANKWTTSFKTWWRHKGIADLMNNYVNK